MGLEKTIMFAATSACRVMALAGNYGVGLQGSNGVPDGGLFFGG
jgi:hypothetical protein